MTWSWTAVNDAGYRQAKELLQADGVLAHYDEKKTLVLVCDASPYGVGALLNHMEPDGREAPTCFASKILTPTEINYAQTDKEALAVVHAAKKFNQYVLGREFVIYTDHKPLLMLMHHSRPVPQMISPCMLNRPGKKLANADALSCLSLVHREAKAPPPLEVLLLEMVPEALLHAGWISSLTQKDPVLSRVLHWLLHRRLAGRQEECFKHFI